MRNCESFGGSTPNRRSICIAVALAVSSNAALVNVVQAQTAFATAQIRDIAFSPDGNLFAACASTSTSDGVLAIWDANSWAVRHVQREAVGYPRLAFSPDSRIMALARFAPEAHVIDAATGEKVGQVAGHKQYCRSVAFTPDGSRLVTGGYDSTVKIWNVETTKLLETITGPFGKVYEVDVSPDGRLLAVADADKFFLRLFDAESLEEVFASKRMGSLVPHVSFEPAGRLVSASSWGGYSRIYDVATKKLVFELDTNSADWTTFSADGRMIAVASQHSIFVYSFPRADEATERRIRQLIDEFDLESYELREAASRELAALGGVCEPYLAEAMETGGPEVRWRTRRLRDRLMSADAATKLDMEGESACAAFSPDGKLLVGGDQAGNLVAWNVQDWTVARKWTMPRPE